MSLVVDIESKSLGYQKSRQRWYWWSQLWSFVSIRLWGTLPAQTQRWVSRIYAKIYDTSWSRVFIRPYCLWHYKDPNYLDQFIPPDGKTRYENFQDFFTREYRHLPTNISGHVWPCEGILCHSGRASDIPTSNVKGDVRNVKDIFGIQNEQSTRSHYFTNIFIHNKNYHRIHAPVDGTITRIEHVPDELVILRPWIYKDNPSVPAFRNERINIDIRDEEKRQWHLSIVGGPAVGTIKVNPQIRVGSKVRAIDELAAFYLGSTCCMLAPVASQLKPFVSKVYLGDTYV